MRERCLSWTLSEGKYNDNDTIIKEDMVLVSCSHYGNAFFVIAGFCCKQTVPYEDIHDDDEVDDGNYVNAERVGLVVYYI